MKTARSKRFPWQWFVMAIAILLTMSERDVAVAQTDSLSFQQAMSRAVKTAAQRVLPSVVSIEVIGVAQTAGNPQAASEVEQDAPSCGLVIDDQGHVLASDIVVRRPSASLLVVLPDQTRLAATVVARDHHRRLVLLKVSGDLTAPAAEFPDELSTEIGSTVVAVGRYGGLGSPIVSSGILSATGRLEGTMLQCDARVSPAFYGGVLVDLLGYPIGLLVPAVAKGGAPDDTSWYDSGIAFAVPTDVIKVKLPRLTAGEDIKKGLIGIVPKATDPYAENTELAAIRNRSPAEKAGIRPGDKVLKVAGQPVRMFQQIRQALGPYDAGEQIEVEIERSGNPQTLSIVLAASIPPLQPQRLGIAVDEQADEAAAANAGEASADDKSAKDKQLIVRDVIPGSAADGVLKPGDQIMRLDQSDATDLATLRRMLITAVPDAEIAIEVLRDGKREELSITPTSIAGAALVTTVPEWADKEPENKWEVAELRLPDVANQAAYVAPKPEDVSTADALGMLILVLPPENREPAKVLESWRDVAGRFGVVVCAVASENDQRWRAKEVDVVARITKMAQQRVPVSEASIALASIGSVDGVEVSAADSMAIAIAMSDRHIFNGIAISEEAKPPAVRLRENEPDHSIQILIPIDSLDDAPTWVAPLMGAGYPVTLGGKNTLADLLRWTRLLQTI